MDKMQKTCHNGNFPQYKPHMCVCVCMRMGLTLNVSIQFGQCIYALVATYSFPTILYLTLSLSVCVCAKFMNNGFPNSIQFNSVESGQWLHTLSLYFILLFFIIDSLWHCFTTVMILTRTVYVRLLLDLLFDIFGFWYW